MKKVILVLLLSILIIVCLFINNVGLSSKDIISDLEMSQEYYSVYYKKYTEAEINRKTKHMNPLLQIIFNDKYTELKNNSLSFEVDFILSNFLIEAQGDSEDILSNEVYEESSILDIKNVESISLQDLENKKIIRVKNQDYKLIDIFGLYCYNNIEKTPVYNYEYLGYELKNNVIYVKYKNNYLNLIETMCFEHTFFGDLKNIEIQVMK